MPRRPALDGDREWLTGVTIVLGLNMENGKSGLNGSRRRPGRESASGELRREVFFWNVFGRRPVLGRKAAGTDPGGVCTRRSPCLAFTFPVFRFPLSARSAAAGWAGLLDRTARSNGLPGSSGIDGKGAGTRRTGRGSRCAGDARPEPRSREPYTGSRPGGARGDGRGDRDPPARPRADTPRRALLRAAACPRAPRATGEKRS